MDLVLAVFFILFVILVGIIPFFLLYFLSDFIEILLLWVFGYRRKVVAENISTSFPGKSPKELRILIKKFYKNLSDILLEGIKAFTMTRRQVEKRHKLLNPELLTPFYKHGRSVIALPFHFTNWEWGSISGGLQLQHRNVVFYKPLNNKWVDRFLRWSRSKYGTELASILRTGKVFEKTKNETVIYIMAADQSPTKSNRIEWIDFMGRETAFLYGPEKYARKYNLPVFFVDIQRVKRGFYELTLSLITDEPRELPGGEITRRYAKAIETAILNQPWNWLWSHRRWKLNR